LPAIATITDFYIVPGLVPSRGPRARDYIIPDSELGGGKHDQYSKYEFRTRDGGIYTGSIKFNDSQKIGTSLCVIYLPQNPWRNLPYPRYDFRVDL
jgi:hypothetical protein